MGFIMNGLDAEAYDRKYTDRQLVDADRPISGPKLARSLVAVMVVLNR